MILEYRQFIPQNVAPKGAVKLGVYDESGNRVMGIPLGTLAPPQGVKQYSFGILADSHIMAQSSGYTGAYPSLKFNNALSFFEENGAAFVGIAGDVTNHGFYTNSIASGGTKDLLQFAEFKRICGLHSIPVYPCGGNHDSYFEPLPNTAADWKTYTGQETYYSITYQNDVFIFLSQSASGTPMSDEAYNFLISVLSANSGKRCFIFVHPYLDSGNVNGAYTNDVFSWWGSKTTNFKNLLAQYPKTVLLHGHSHFKWEEQTKDKTANYSNISGFHSMHVPSVTAPAFVNDSGSREQITTESYGFLVDVYADCVHFQGINFGTVNASVDGMENGGVVPLGTFKIEIAEG